MRLIFQSTVLVVVGSETEPWKSLTVGRDPVFLLSVFFIFICFFNRKLDTLKVATASSDIRADQRAHVMGILQSIYNFGNVSLACRSDGDAPEIS